MDKEIRALVNDHVRAIEALALAGDLFSVKTLACMALLIDEAGGEPPDGGGEQVIELAAYRTRLAPQ